MSNVETDNQVWENKVRCFMKNISKKKQAKMNDLRQTCFFLKYSSFIYLFRFFIHSYFFFFDFSGKHVRTGSYDPARS